MNSSAESIRHALAKQPSTKCVTDYFRNIPKIEKSLPPTQSCLSNHVQRAHYHSRVWYLADNTSPDHVLPINNGWNKDPTSGQLHPQLMVEDPLPQEFSDIVYYKCKKLCNCKMHLQIQAAKVHRCMLMQRRYLPEPIYYDGR